MRFLITGGAGFIGSNFVRLMVNSYPDDEIIVLDKLTYAGRLENLAGVKERITFIKGDICNREDVKKAGDCEVIFNFAAETHVDRSIENADEFVRTDVLGTNTLLNHAQRNDIDAFIQISTDEVYGSTATGSFLETDSLNPSSPYSASKSAADLLVKAYHNTYELPVMITRSSNNFGPYQYPEKLIPVLILQAIHNSPLPLYGNGTNVRDWIYVGDNCEAIRTIYEKGEYGEIYNIGGGCEKQNIEIAQYILAILGKPESLIQYVTDRPGHDFRYSVNCDKLRSLGWSPRHPFEDALRKTVAWYVENQACWKTLRA